MGWFKHGHTRAGWQSRLAKTAVQRDRERTCEQEEVRIVNLDNAAMPALGDRYGR